MKMQQFFIYYCKIIILPNLNTVLSEPILTSGKSRMRSENIEERFI